MIEKRSGYRFVEKDIAKLDGAELKRAQKKGKLYLYEKGGEDHESVNWVENKLSREIGDISKISPGTVKQPNTTAKSPPFSISAEDWERIFGNRNST